jgi:hypothetical protein
MERRGSEVFSITKRRRMRLRTRHTLRTDEASQRDGKTARNVHGLTTTAKGRFQMPGACTDARRTRGRIAVPGSIGAPGSARHDNELATGAVCCAVRPPTRVNCSEILIAPIRFTPF